MLTIENLSKETLVEIVEMCAKGEISSDEVELQALRAELGRIAPKRVHVADDNASWQADLFHVFAFGVYDSTYVVAWGSLEDALEDAAECLKGVAPGCFVGPEVPDNYEALDEDEQDKAHNDATADLTYTESGYLPSWEWSIVLSSDSGATFDDVLKFARGQ